MFNHTLEGGEGGGGGSRGGRGVQGGVPPLLLRCTAVLIHPWSGCGGLEKRTCGPKKRGPSTPGPRHRKLAAHPASSPYAWFGSKKTIRGRGCLHVGEALWRKKRAPGTQGFGKTREEVEDEGRGGRRGKRWRTREEVEDEGRGGGRGKRWRTREEVEDEGRRGS